jgi:hypothetical protein
MNEFEMYVCINGIHAILLNGMMKNSTKEIPPLIMASIEKEPEEVFFESHLLGEQKFMHTCFRVMEPDNFCDENKSKILQNFGRIAKKENEKVRAVFVAASFVQKEKNEETGEIDSNECFVICCLTKQGEKLARIIPMDRDPEGNILLLNTTNQFSKNFDFSFIKDFYRGYNGFWSFSKMFGDN